MTTKEQALKDAVGRMKAGHWLTGAEVRELPSILWEDELPERLVAGYYGGGNGLVVATNKRLLFVNKGLLGGLKVEDFPYDKMSSLEYSTGLVMGNLTVYTSGNRAKIENIEKSEVREFAEYVRARVSAVAESKATGRSAGSEPREQPPDLLGQIERLASLRQRGLLTEEEFALAKKKLLST